MHNHEHDHDHHSIQLTNISRAFVVGIILNSVFVIIEFISGFMTNSLALLSDAGHNLSDVASLGLSLFAFKISKSKATSKFTYGYHKSTILASLANAVVLLIAVGSIGWEAIQRFITPEETKGNTIAIVAGVGIIINAVSAFLFFRDKEKDLNAKGAYIHLATDAIVSAGVVVAGILISFTGIKWIDPMISLVIMSVVIFSTWGLLKESLYLSLDAVPKNVDIEKIKETVLKVKGVKDIHHVHIWGMSTSKNGMTAHLILENSLDEKKVAEIKHKVKHELEHVNIQHVTLETENELCADEKC
jgi:cobalt-zinc-cadmium efflux system protein